jgi:hypothetical protein
MNGFSLTAFALNFEPRLLNHGRRNVLGAKTEVPMFLRLQSAVSLFTCSCLISMASATPSTIGLVMTSGEVQVDGSSVRGNSAIFSGSLVSSGDANSSLQFFDGTNAVMRPGATMKVYREHSVLQQGVTMQRGVDKHAVFADGLKISGATPNAVALIGVKDASHVEVAGQAGETTVWTSSGNLVARVEPGKTLSFSWDDASTSGIPANGVRIYGILRPHYLLTDEQTNVTYRLQGSGLDAFVGASVAVTGTVLGGNPASNTPPVVSVANVVKMGNDGEMALGQQGGARPAGQSSVWTKRNIIFLIVVAVGGTLLGLGVSGAFSSGRSVPVTPATP